MSYINKALKDFTNQLKNDYQMEINTSKADTTGGKRDYYLTLYLGDDKELTISINHCTKDYLHSEFCVNHKYYFTPWGVFDNKKRSAIKYANQHKIPVLHLHIGLYDSDYRINHRECLCFGYKDFTNDEILKRVKEVIEAYTPS